ncbi:MAG: PDDEXK nuclease domain-containing protein [Oscillospiraceae bacterium]|nr:PDDEXK nuclease domain-containing protein [Oscillospiraceae bacterium]
MSTSIVGKSNSDYSVWLNNLKDRYLSSRMKAAVAVNTSLLEFYYSIGRDISQSNYINEYGSAFYETLSKDLRRELPDVKGLSATNLKYTRYFYELYSPHFEMSYDDSSNNSNLLIVADENRPQPVDDFSINQLFMIPWSHHRTIIDKCKNNTEKAIFYVKQTLKNNWSRSVLLNYISSDLYGRQGKAISNYAVTLPMPQGDLAQEITKDPYSFDFLTLRDSYDEKELKDALLENITKFLIELGTGFAFMGREYRVSVGEDDYYIDLLFYHVQLHAYVVLEVKTGKFQPADLGQLGFYISAVNHSVKSENDNPTIGLLICKDKNNLTAKYSLESSNQPIGISEYELSKIYPADFKGSMPTIEEIEESLEESK